MTEQASYASGTIRACGCCGQNYRVPVRAGMKAIRCPKCGNPLPNPYIFERLLVVHTTVVQIAENYHALTFWRRSNSMNALDKQRRLLANFEQWPGFTSTRIACMWLWVEIEIAISSLQRKLGSSSPSAIWKILKELLDLVIKYKTWNQPQLTAGPSAFAATAVG